MLCGDRGDCSDCTRRGGRVGKLLGLCIMERAASTSCGVRPKGGGLAGELQVQVELCDQVQGLRLGPATLPPLSPVQTRSSGRRLVAVGASRPVLLLRLAVVVLHAVQQLAQVAVVACELA